MKRILSFLMLGAIVAFTSCQKETLAPVGNGSEISVTINAKTGAMQTRAGAPTNIDNYVLEVYYQGKLYGTQQTNTNGTFNVKLVSGKAFTVICWADQGADVLGKKHYNTDNLTAVKLVEPDQYDGNDATRDAYVGKTTVTLTADSKIDIVMKRPFGQLNIKTNDFDDMKDPLIPTQISIAYALISTQFNALTGELSGEKSVTFKSSDIKKAPDNTKEGDKWLSFDYIFASEEESTLIDFTATLSNASDDAIVVNNEFKSVPIQRNFRTFVSGNLLTNSGDIAFNFEEWDPTSHDVDIVEVSKPSEITEITKTKNAFVVTEQVTTNDATISIPENTTASETASISFSFPQGVKSDATLLIKDAKDTAPYDGDVYINVANGTTVQINLPDATVYLNGTKVSNMSTHTAANTFIVAKDSEISETLTVNGGNVYVYGKVGTIVRGDDNQDALTTVYVFPGATVTTLSETNQLKRVDVTGGIITNTTQHKKYPTIKAAVADADANDVIELTEGDYPLTTNLDVVNADGKDYYLAIDKSITLKGIGNVVLFPQGVVKTGMQYCHAAVHTFNSNVVFENITFMPTIIDWNNDIYSNKTIEVHGGTVDVVNCKFVSNNKVESYENVVGGSLYYAEQATGKVTGTTFVGTSLATDGLMSGRVVAENCTFDAGFINTPNWTSNDVSQSTMVIDINNCKFINTNNSPVAEERIVQAKFGTINLKNCQFPTDDIYWKAIESGTITVNGIKQALYIQKAEDLRKAMVNPNVVEVVLENDIEWISSDPNGGNADNQDAFKIGNNDLTGDPMEYYKSRPMDGFVLNGNGKTISGVAYNNVMGVYAHNVTIKNLVIQQTNDQKNTRKNAGLSIYRSINVLIENVTIDNVGKSAIIINAATATAKNVTTQTSGTFFAGVDVTKGGAPAGGNRPVFTFDVDSKFDSGTPTLKVSKNAADDYQINLPAGQTWTSKEVNGEIWYTKEN